MNFDKIELIGFKSFADRLEIRFDAGVTGIVGPNGCGKSNVADAIRWVLGEQSAKTLRGSSMQDVIFSGTQNRKSLSYCEVSLHFDNTNRIFSLDYNEVVITRKLYRSGESEYYINRQPSRLRDIVELLHECGIGKEGYSIIGQGKVEELLSAKPEERRAIFEEATGIAKFKGKKAEIERKLMRTRENLVRYIDILSELERQLGPLQKQADDARKYNAIAEELKYHEINHYIYKFNNVNKEKDKVQARINAAIGEIVSREDQFKTIQSEYEANSAAIIEADENIQKMNEKILENSVAYEKRLGDVKLYGERINSCKADIRRLNGEIESCAARAEKLREEISRKEEERKENVELIRQLDERAAKLNIELMEINRQLAKGEDDAQESRQKVLDSLQTMTDIKINITSISEKRNALSDKREDLEKRIASLRAKMAEVEAEGAGYMRQAEELGVKNEDLKNLISDKEKLSVAIADKIKEFNGKLYNLNSQLASLEAKKTIFKDIKNSYEGFGEAVKFLLRSAAGDKSLAPLIKGVVAKVIKTEKQYELAMETALGGSMQSVITDTPEDTKALIDFLKRKNGGRVTFLPISSVKARYDGESIKSALRERGAVGLATELVQYDKYFDGVIRNLLGNTLIVDQIDNAIAISRKYAHAFKIVTLAGELFATQGSITGGSNNRNTHLLGSDRQLDAAEKEIAAVKEAMEKGGALVAEYEQRAKKTAEEIEIIRGNIQNNKESAMLFSEKSFACGAEYEELKRELDGLHSETEALDSVIEELSKEFTDVEEGGAKLDALKKSADKDLEKNRAIYEQMRKKRDSLSEEFTNIQVKTASVNSGQNLIIADIGRMESEIASLKATAENDRAALAQTESILSSLTLSAEKMALSDEEQSAVNDMRKALEKLEEDKKRIVARQAETDAKKQSLQSEILRLSDKKNDEELALGRIDSDIEYMQQRILEEYGYDTEDCMAYRDENYDDGKSHAEISRLKKEKQALKNVNPNAIEDFNATNDRYNEMRVQKEDVEKAENDLMIALETLTNDMVKTFNEGFDLINENFKRTFKELFGGGNARLELDYTDVDDPLEAGIEIVAEPPGKKLQKISLLSGGERALTAIAILFSIIQMRPMPFCVLDEIEAALDDANVDRFAKYLKKFSEKTQFIVITHRKPTMEMADALYGVTMEEKGVSKMVSVKLSDIVDDLETA